MEPIKTLAGLVKDGELRCVNVGRGKKNQLLIAANPQAAVALKSASMNCITM